MSLRAPAWRWLTAVWRSGPNHGHYITIVRRGNKWIVFDDDLVEVLQLGPPCLPAPILCCAQEIDELELNKYYGEYPGTGSGYVLFYEASELEMQVFSKE